MTKDKEHIIQNDDGSYSIKKWDQEYKMWVTIKFAKEVNAEVDAHIIELLSNEYLKQHTAS